MNYLPAVVFFCGILESAKGKGAAGMGNFVREHEDFLRFLWTFIIVAGILFFALLVFFPLPVLAAALLLQDRMDLIWPCRFFLAAFFGIPLLLEYYVGL
jgi:hypothetical protein